MTKTVWVSSTVEVETECVVYDDGYVELKGTTIVGGDVVKWALDVPFTQADYLDGLDLEAEALELADMVEYSDETLAAHEYVLGEEE